MDSQQTCIQKQKHLTNIYFYQNLRQLYIIAPITTVRGPFMPYPLKKHETVNGTLVFFFFFFFFFFFTFKVTLQRKQRSSSRNSSLSTIRKTQITFLIGTRVPSQLLAFKAYGPDEIPTFILRASAEELSSVLSVLYQRSLEMDVYLLTDERPPLYPCIRKVKK